MSNHLPSLIEEDCKGSVSCHTTDTSSGISSTSKALESQASSFTGYQATICGSDSGGSSGKSSKLKHGGQQEIGQISEFRKFREAYLGAVFPFLGSRYRVRAHEEDGIILDDAEPHIRTDPSFYTYENR